MVTKKQRAKLDPAVIAEKLRAAHAMRVEADRVTKYYVEEAVRAGMSWSDIGRCLEVTKQSAHRKYAAGLPRDLRNPS
ncbi:MULTISPECIES: hypothetical protein [Actinotignum]|uniref:RNA polymerase sigma factor 70 region 4 type 2 domain-containing protein n=1 Tax=Actinotignum schaalii FB123-CNA-2 TaxID=883067 RepID=S2VMM9_9ACTO|nr:MULTISPECIES: hypothetical protein [Actinotignum]EPD28713.1 hypothetical protein HMPREF9237_00241 [Actinotignum schaalii FB123-CNA-2]MDK8782404.1 hypothetical protein [Actinotignum timonense]